MKKKPAKKADPDKALRKLCDDIVSDIFCEVHGVYIKSIGDLSDRLMAAEATGTALRASVDELSAKVHALECKPRRAFWWTSG